MISWDAGHEVTAALKNVSVSYHGDIYVLRDLSLQFRKGLVTGIIGPNGAGKSTVLKTLIGALRPRAGDVCILGNSILDVKTHEIAGRQVGFVPQGRSLFLELSVQDNLKLGCWTFRHEKVRVQEAISNVFSLFPELKDKQKAPAGSLSGGQRRFLEIARALLPNPPLLLLDEPTAMIAPKFASQIYERIKAFAAQGATIVLVDQNIRRCVDVSDFIYVLELGRMRAQGSAEDLRSETSLKNMIADWLEVSGG